LGGAVSAVRPQPLARDDGGVQDDRGAVRQERQRLLYREQEAFHVDVEDRVVELLGDRAQGRIPRDAGVGEDDVKPALLALDLGEQAVHVVEVRNVATDGGDLASDLLDRRRDLGLRPAGDEDVATFVHEPLRRREADAAAAARNESGFPLKLRHISILFAMTCRRQAFGVNNTLPPLWVAFVIASPTWSKPL